MKTPNSKLITVFFHLAMLLMLSATVKAQYTYTTNANNTITITKYTGAGGPVVIPSRINSLPVTSIGDSSFRNYTSLTSLTIPDGITSIGSKAFRGCTSLADVVIGANVTSIGSDAFRSCTGLTIVMLGSSVASIGDDAFHGCSSLTNVYFQGNAPALGSSVFDRDVTVYYLLGTTGFGKKFDRLETALWSGPTVVTNADAQLGGIPIILTETEIAFNPPWLGAGWTATSCTWDFGDGTTSLNCNPTHTFTNCQTYAVSYRGTDGVTTMSTKTIIAVPCAMTAPARKTKAKLNFARNKADSFKLSALVDLGSQFSVDGKVVMLSFGEAELSFTLGASGRAFTLKNRCGLTYDKKTRLWKLRVIGKSKEWQEAWATYGLTNETVAKPGRSVTVPVLVLVGEEVFANTQSMRYTAKAGKSGAAK